MWKKYSIGTFSGRLSVTKIQDKPIGGRPVYLRAADEDNQGQ